MAVAAQVGCSLCLDINYFQGLKQNLDVAKASKVPRWHESELLTPLERNVLEYAEPMTDTPPILTDELSALWLYECTIVRIRRYGAVSLAGYRSRDLARRLVLNLDRATGAMKGLVVAMIS